MVEGHIQGHIGVERIVFGGRYLFADACIKGNGKATVGSEEFAQLEVGGYIVLVKFLLVALVNTLVVISKAYGTGPSCYGNQTRTASLKVNPLVAGLAAQPPRSLKSVSRSSLNHTSVVFSSRLLLRTPIMMVRTLARLGFPRTLTVLLGFSGSGKLYSLANCRFESDLRMASFLRSLTSLRSSRGRSSRLSSGQTIWRCPGLLST